MAHGIPARLTADEGRRFAFTVGAAFLFIAGFAYWRGSVTTSVIVGTPGALLLLAGAFAPHRLGPVYRGWMRFALLLSRITTPVFMAIVYFGVITPIGLIRRWTGNNPIGSRSQQSTYWRMPERSVTDLRRQF